MRARQKLRKVSEDVLARIIEVLKELEETHQELLRKYFDLGRWVDLAIEEGASYRDIAEELKDHQIYGYSDRSLRRAHKFYQFVVEYFEGDIEVCLSWLEDKYPEVKVELIDLLVSKKPKKKDEGPDQQLIPETGETVSGEEEQEEEVGEESGLVSWLKDGEAYHSLLTPDWRTAEKLEGKISLMLQAKKVECIREFESELKRRKLPTETASIFLDMVQRHVENLVARIEAEFKAILKEEGLWTG